MSNSESLDERNEDQPLVDVPSGLITANKADSFDIGMVTYPVDCRNRTVHDIQHTIGQACPDAPSDSSYAKGRNLQHLLACRAQQLSLLLRGPFQMA